MNLTLITAIIFGLVSQMEADKSDTLGNLLGSSDSGIDEAIILNDFFRNNKDVSGFGFGNNINRNIGTNSWLNLLGNRAVTGILQNEDIFRNNKDVDPEIAKRYLGVVDLLNQLKEPIRLKTEEKLGENIFPNNNNDLKAVNNGKYGTNILFPNLQNTTTIENDDDIDPEVAKRFPGLVKLLNKLKELNKLKNQGKLTPGNNGDENDKNKTSSGKTGNTGNSKNDKYGKDNPKNYYFQAQPVVPDNERKDKNGYLFNGD